MKNSFIIALGLTTLITSLSGLADARPPKMIRSPNPGLSRTIIAPNTGRGGYGGQGYSYYGRPGNYSHGEYYSRPRQDIYRHSDYPYDRRGGNYRREDNYHYRRQGNYGYQGYYHRRQDGYSSQQQIIIDQTGRRICLNC